MTNDQNNKMTNSSENNLLDHDRESRIRAIVDTVVDGIITIDQIGTIETFNPAAERIFGYALEDVIGQNVRMLMPAPYRGEHDGYLHSYLTSGEAKVIGIGREVVGLRKDGSTFPMELGINEMKVGGERMFTGIVRDISERKQAEQDISDREERTRAIVDTVVDGIITIDQIGTIETFNPAAERIFGYALEDVIGQNVRMLMPAPYRGEHDGYLHSYLTSGEAKVIGIGREVIGLRKDGLTFPMELAVNEMKVGGKRKFTGIVRDISERKKAEQDISDREERTRAIVDTVVDGIITIDQIGTIETFNPAAERIFGYTLGDVVGQNVRMLMPAPYRGEHDGYLHSYLTKGEAKVIGIGREVVGLRKDGSTFPMELAVNEMKVGKKRMFTGIVRDISDRKEADRVKAEFVSTVSHELRTPLTSIKGSLGLVRSGAIGEVPEKLRSMIDIAYQNSGRLVLLINDILDMEKIKAGKMDYVMETIDVASLVDEAIEANKGYGDEHKVTFVKGAFDTNAQIHGDKGRLIQVLSNLMSNAAKFSPDGERVEMSIVQNDKTVRVAVKDNGPGIPDNFRKTIFQKFSQADSSDTRKKGGTGLGLTITKVIVEQHGGTLGFDSKTGEGSTFFFDLPVLEPQIQNSTPEIGWVEKYRILICENETDTEKPLGKILEDAGYLTQTAETAETAVHLLETQDFDALTLDPGFEEQNNISLLEKIRTSPKTQDLPVIVISTSSKEGQQGMNGNAFGIVDWIEKPIETHLLIDRLKKAVKTAAGGKPKILHVEDDVSILQIVSALIADSAEIVPATTVHEARILLTQDMFDLVILDLKLPDGEGESLLPLLNKPGHPSIPVIIFSAKDVSRETAESIKAVLVKSRTTNEVLLHTIQSTIEAS